MCYHFMLKSSEQPMILRTDQCYRKPSESYRKHDHTSSSCQKGKLEKLDIKRLNDVDPFELNC